MANLDDSSFDCRSQVPASEASSHIARPRWHRLLRAAAVAISNKIADVSCVEELHAATNQISPASFCSQDASGGGTEVDVYACLHKSLMAMELTDEESGSMIIGTYHFLQPEDLPLSSQTWRGLVVTALLATVHVVFKSKDAGAVAEKLHGSVAHWWPKSKASAAYKVFSDREPFKTRSLTPSSRASVYFELRDAGLRMSPEEGSNTYSGAFSYEQSMGSDKRVAKAPLYPATSPVPRPAPAKASSQSRAGHPTAQPSESSLMYSDASAESSIDFTKYEGGIISI